MIKVMEWEMADTSDGNGVYRLDGPEEAARFFRDLLANDVGDEDSFKVIEMTDDEWAEAVRQGNELL